MEGRKMKNKTTRLSQLRELHQRIVDQPGHSPTARWELWGRIHRAERLLAVDSVRSPSTSDRNLAEEKRSLFGRLSLMAVVVTCALALAVQLSSLAGGNVRSLLWTPLVGTALVAGVSAGGFAMRADEYQRVIDLLDEALALEPKGASEADATVDVVFDADTEWVWVCECDENPVPPIFNAANQVPLLAVV